MLEGGEGCGKDEHGKLLTKFLYEKTKLQPSPKPDIILTKELGGTPESEKNKKDSFR